MELEFERVLLRHGDHLHPRAVLPKSLQAASAVVILNGHVRWSRSSSHVRWTLYGDDLFEVSPLGGGGVVAVV